MILATRAGNRELRTFGANTAVAPAPWVGSRAWSGEHVSHEKALGLAAFGRAHRLVCGVVASLPMFVWEGTGGDKQRRDQSPQGRLLANPVAGLSLFDWKWDVASSLETDENAFLLKVRGGDGRVLELQPIPNEYVVGRLDRRGGKVFEVWTEDGRILLTSLDVLHIRGQTVKGGPFGVSRIQQHLDPVGSMVAAQRFEGAYFRNDARPGLIVETGTERVTVQQANEWVDNWTARHQGPDNAGKPTILGGGWKATVAPVSLRDAQFIEGRQFSVEETGRIMDVDPALLGAPEDGDVRRTALEMFLKLQLPPRLRRIESALRADLDLFQVNDPLYPEFRVDDLMFADPLTRAQVQHYRVQDGTELVDEARADNGRQPLPDGAGQVPQITPVGGAPNPALEPTDDDAEEARGLVPLSVPSMTVNLEQDMTPVADAVAASLSQAIGALGRAQMDAVELERRARTDHEKRLLVQQREEREQLIRALEGLVVNVAAPEVNVPVEVNVPQQPVSLTVELPPQREKHVTFDRDTQGRVSGATVTEE